MPTRSVVQSIATGRGRFNQFNDSYVRDLHTQLAEAGRKLWASMSPATSAFDLCAILHWMQNGQEISSSVPARISTSACLAAYVDGAEPILSIGLMGANR